MRVWVCVGEDFGFSLTRVGCDASTQLSNIREIRKLASLSCRRREVARLSEVGGLVAILSFRDDTLVSPILSFIPKIHPKPPLPPGVRKRTGGIYP